MEVLLTQAKNRGTHFCEGIPLVPTLEEVARMLAREQSLKMDNDAAAAGRARPARRVRATIVDYRERGELTFFVGKGEAMRLSDGHTKPALNAVGFFLYTMCEGNEGDMWPDTMGAPGLLHCAQISTHVIPALLYTGVVAAHVACKHCAVTYHYSIDMQRPWMWREQLQGRHRAGTPT
jgi:hypothetical protein